MYMHLMWFRNLKIAFCLQRMIAATIRKHSNSTSVYPFVLRFHLLYINAMFPVITSLGHFSSVIAIHGRSSLFYYLCTYGLIYIWKDINHSHIYMQASFRLYNIVELIDSIIQLCNWSSLVALTNTCVCERCLVNNIIHKRVATCTAHFVSPKSLNRFFELVKLMSTALVGFVRHIMCLNEDVYDGVYPRNMDIIVPIGAGWDRSAAWRFAHFLSNAGPCSQMLELESLSPLYMVSQSTFLCSSEVLFNFIFLQILLIHWFYVAQAFCINVIECEDSNIFKVFLAASETALFNMLMSHHIYSFYLSLLSRRANVATSNYVPPQSSMLSSFNFGLTMFDSKQVFSDFPGICRESCYSKTHSLFGLEGVLVNRWGGIAGFHDDGTYTCDRSKTDGYETLDYQWRIGSNCLNPLCPYYGVGYRNWLPLIILFSFTNHVILVICNTQQTSCFLLSPDWQKFYQ